MRWTNAGHQLENWREVFLNKDIVIYGAGKNGRELYDEMFFAQKNIIAFIDRKHCDMSKPVISLEEAVVNNIFKNSIIIISPDGSVGAHIALQLTRFGLQAGKTFFYYRDWINYYLPIYSLYNLDIVRASFISLQFSNICNLKCGGCLACTPQLKKQSYFGMEEFKSNVDSIFRNIDIVGTLDICGGEPFLIKEFGQLIEYVGEGYKEKIGTIRTVSNGTILPDDETCSILSRYKVKVILDDYRECNIGKIIYFDEIRNKFERLNVDYEINYTKEWYDLQLEKNDIRDEKSAGIRFDECANHMRSIHRMKLYVCDYADYANEAGYVIGDEKDYIDLSLPKRIEKAKMVEFLLGYTEKGYCEMCKQCSGTGLINTKTIPVARQI